jgi:oxygen-independent coproporphyrinogen-3 oxidase
MLRLRLEEGISTEEYHQRFGRDFHAEFDGILAPYRHAGLLREVDGHVALTTEGMLLSNTILADLLATM